MRSPCISIRQPWAALIVLGLKDVENRTWRFPDKLTGVAVKRVQEMTEEDAMAWGMNHVLVPGWQYQGKQTALESARVFWDSRYAKRGLSFDSNSWCYVTSTEKAERP